MGGDRLLLNVGCSSAMVFETMTRKLPVNASVKIDLKAKSECLPLDFGPAQKGWCQNPEAVAMGSYAQLAA
jgi:hypothetical protein